MDIHSHFHQHCPWPRHHSLFILLALYTADYDRYQGKERG